MNGFGVALLACIWTDLSDLFSTAIVLAGIGFSVLIAVQIWSAHCPWRWKIGGVVELEPRSVVFVNIRNSLRSLFFFLRQLQPAGRLCFADQKALTLSQAV